MLRRKIESYLEEWKRNSNHKPLVIKGVRQCGKTYSVQQFVKTHYNHFVYVDFVENPDFKEAFYGAKTVDSIIMNLSGHWSVFVYAGIWNPSRCAERELVGLQRGHL
ncbi:MAG: AAA family ATPase [Bacteroidales bacterium]|nr:AAA family ATPase [Bacteroidales bacterium]